MEKGYFPLFIIKRKGREKLDPSNPFQPVNSFGSGCDPAKVSKISQLLIELFIDGNHHKKLVDAFDIGRGYKRFFKRTLLETSDYLKDDCLSIQCTVGVVRSHTEGPKIYSISSPPSDIGQHFGQLLETGEGTDVRFEVDGEIFAAHKLVLAARSPVFRAQLFGPLKDQNTQWIKVDEMEVSVFKALLHFIYWDGLPDMQEIVGLGSKWASTLMSQHLLAAADRYGLERLRLLCEAKLCEDVAINTVGTTLALAEQHHCFPLKSVCLKFVAQPENLKAVMQTEGFQYLKESCPSVITELLEYVALIGKHSVTSYGYGSEKAVDGSEVNGRRVKQRVY
ncbi:unnamed protein product [Ilex paraguariensis]|uniref:BTB domain-containing protein n=1 Tax=Ilex paraguariensis TaxID=185542 RepID=A0ABC8TXQ6_9AQUA